MRNRLRKRSARLPSPALVVALLALLAALGGTGTAAVLVTSADIKNSTIQGIDVKQDALTGGDVKEATLARVPNANKLDGLDSTRFLPGSNVPRGTTLRGVFAIEGRDAVPTFPDLRTAAISFGYTLASAPTPHFIVAGMPTPSQCPGTASAPQAAVGHLCVYEASRGNILNVSIANPISNTAGATRYGAELIAESNLDGFFTTQGSWAVTAP